MKKLPEPRFRLPRVWSNQELRRIANLFYGDIVNVSAWRDEDKEGGYYKDYFINAKSYSLTNFKSEARGFQGVENEIFLDLTADLPVEMEQRFDVVFNHTTLEHIFEVDKALNNLCKLSKDVVIVVVPFLQEMHAEYGDYWRFTPLALQRMFDKNSYETVHLTFNKNPGSSVYVFAVAVRNAVKWRGNDLFKIELGLSNERMPETVIGFNAFSVFNESLFNRILKKFKSFFR